MKDDSDRRHLAEESLNGDLAYTEARAVVVELCQRLPVGMSERALELLDVIDSAPRHSRPLYLGVHRELVEYTLQQTENAELFRALMDGELALNEQLTAAVKTLRVELVQSNQLAEGQQAALKRIVGGSLSDN